MTGEAPLEWRLVQAFIHPENLEYLDLPAWFDETARLLAVVELTHWSVAEIERTPAVLIDRMLLLCEARALAHAELSRREG